MKNITNTKQLGEEVKALNRMIFVPVIIAIAILAVYPVLLPPHVAKASVGAWKNCLWWEGSDPPSWVTTSAAVSYN